MRVRLPEIWRDSGDEVGSGVRKNSKITVREERDMTKYLAIIGIVGGLLCAVADLLLDIKGADNEKLGHMGVIDSKWASMKHGRFVASTILAMVAIPMYSCGFIALMQILAEKNTVLAGIMSVIFLCGAMGGFMIHTFLCMVPTMYQITMKKGDFELANEVISKTFRQIYVPFYMLYTLLVIIPSIVVMVLIATRMLLLPRWTMLCNPVAFQIIGLLFRATKCKLFVDAPSCCAASLGLAMYGVLALMLI